MFEGWSNPFRWNSTVGAVMRGADAIVIVSREVNVRHARTHNRLCVTLRYCSANPDVN